MNTVSSPVTDASLAVPTNMTAVDRHTWYTVFLIVTQTLIWPISFIVFNLRYRLKIVGREDLKDVRSPLIIIANHVSILDGFLLRFTLGISTPLIPMRFMAVRKFNLGWLNFLAEIGFIDFVYGVFGVFTIVPGRGMEKNLEVATRIIRSNGTVVMYPEGRLEKDNTIAPFKPGAAVLAGQTGVPVLPVAFRLGRRKWLRRDMTVNFGSVMRVAKEVNPDESTRVFFDRVVELHGSK